MINNPYIEKYPPELLGDVEIISIPLYEKCPALFRDYITPLINEGYKYSEDYNYNCIYLIKAFRRDTI